MSSTFSFMNANIPSNRKWDFSCSMDKRGRRTVRMSLVKVVSAQDGGRLSPGLRTPSISAL